LDRVVALVTLRWRSDLRALFGMRERAVGLVLALPGLVLFGALGALIAYFGIRAASVHRPELLLPLISIAATGFGLFWVLSPVLAGVAFSETHDVDRLLHFPVPVHVLVVSSLLANLTQPMVLAEIPLVLATAAATAAGRPAAFLPCLVAVVLSMLFVLAAAQLAGLALQSAARNRRLQDVALFAGLVVSFVLGLAPLLILLTGAGALGPTLRRVLELDLFALSPFSWGVRAAVHAGRGEVAAAVTLGLAAAAATGVALAAASVLIERMHRGEMSLGPPAGARSRPARMLSGGPLGALLEKDLRVAWREPALKASLLLGLLGPLIFLIFLLQLGPRARSGGGILLLASLVGLSSFGANAFGLERRGIALLLAFPVERWRILAAKNLAGLAFRAPGLLTLLVAAPLVAPAAFVIPALCIAAITLALAAAMDNYASILFPVAVPAPGRSPHAASSGARGFGAAALGAVLLAGALAVSAPFVLLIWLPPLLEAPWLWGVAVPLALLGAGAAYAMLVGGAARLLERREPELAARILGEA
jgi:ABC-2 type transport system permease protein